MGVGGRGRIHGGKQGVYQGYIGVRNLLKEDGMNRKLVKFGRKGQLHSGCQPWKAENKGLGFVISLIYCHTVYTDCKIPTRAYHLTIRNGFDLAKHVQQECHRVDRKLTYPEANLTDLIRHVYPIDSEQSIWCAVEKVASTFWRRVLYLLHHPTEKRKKTPYQISINTGLGFKYPRLIHGNDSKIEDYFKFMFVRNPYHRVLSAYIDKVFAPNPMFWDRFGKPSITKFRNVKGVRKCYHDASFAEFIQFVVWSETEKKQTDHHFLQASEICQPCAVKYAFIGKQENFVDDAGNMFEKFGLNETKRSLHSDMKKEAIADAIRDSIDSPYQWKGQIRRCMSWEEALKRVWRKMQIRGLIDMDKAFPFNGTAMKKLTNSRSSIMFKTEAMKAHASSDPEKLKKQKQMAFIEMYSSVPLHVLNAFKDVYANDFKLFNYEERPESIFVRDNRTNSSRLTNITTI